MNEENLNRYAKILIDYGVGLEEGQRLYVQGQVAHRVLAAYERGSLVECRLVDPLLTEPLIRYGPMECVDLDHDRDRLWFNEIVRSRGAFIALVGSELPHLMPELARTHPERQAAHQRGRAQAMAGFEAHGILRRLCPYVIAACPTTEWTRKVFPELGEAAYDRLAELIFGFTSADRPNALELVAAKDRQLKARCRALDALAITEIRIAGGETDLTIGLSPHARWLGGRQKTVTGQLFTPNLPTEECFTTPDRRLTAGRMAATMPLRTPRGIRVDGLVLTFRAGEVVDFDAAEGKDAVAELLAADPGAGYLGEIALVGQDSPVARSGRFFDLYLLDENAASHVALGQGYPTAFAGAEATTAEELAELGCNRSDVHVDVMFGSQRVDVLATRTREGEVSLIERGLWTERFAAAGPGPR